MKIQCQTLFDITRTAVHSRRHRLADSGSDAAFELQRGQQSNFDTLIQIVSMRAGPENITDPEKSMIQLDGRWGSQYRSSTKIPLWTFCFTVEQPEVYNNGVTPLGYLLSDCQGVPMIVGLGEWRKIHRTLCTDDLHRNITFKVVE